MVSLEEAHGWLTWTDGSYLSDLTRQAVERLRSGICAGEIEAAREQFRALANICWHSKGDLEIAEAFVEAGVIAYQNQLYGDAERCFNLAIYRYGPRWHYHSVVKWMLGCVFWQVPDRHWQAQDAWQRSIAKFETLATWRLLSSREIAWYNQKLGQMVDTLASTLAERSNEGIERQPLPERRQQSLLISNCHTLV